MAKSVNLFSQAKSSPTAKASKEKPAEQKLITKGLEIYAQIDALAKQLAALQTGMKPELHAQMYKQFIVNKGENYKGEENSSSASLELRKRASTSGLKEAELELLKRHNISTVYIDGEFKLNVGNVSAKKLQEVSDAISSVKGLPENFVEFDASKTRTITSETSIDEVLKLNDIDTIMSLLPVVGVPAIKAKTTDSMKAIMKAVTDLLVEAE